MGKRGETGEESNFMPSAEPVCGCILRTQNWRVGVAKPASKEAGDGGRSRTMRPKPHLTGSMHMTETVEKDERVELQISFVLSRNSD